VTVTVSRPSAGVVGRLSALDRFLPVWIMATMALKNDHWRARYGATRPAGVRREALRCIPGAVGRNSEGGSWIT
jgi:hypothetical protein